MNIELIQTINKISNSLDNKKQAKLADRLDGVSKSIIVLNDKTIAWLKIARGDNIQLFLESEARVTNNEIAKIANECLKKGLRDEAADLLFHVAQIVMPWTSWQENKLRDELYSVINPFLMDTLKGFYNELSNLPLAQEEEQQQLGQTQDPQAYELADDINTTTSNLKTNSIKKKAQQTPSTDPRQQVYNNESNSSHLMPSGLLDRITQSIIGMQKYVNSITSKIENKYKNPRSHPAYAFAYLIKNILAVYQPDINVENMKNALLHFSQEIRDAEHQAAVDFEQSTYQKKQMEYQERKRQTRKGPRAPKAPREKSKIQW